MVIKIFHVSLNVLLLYLMKLENYNSVASFV